METYTLAIFKEGGTVYYGYDSLELALEEALLTLKSGATPVNITNGKHEVLYNYHDIMSLHYTKGKQ